MELLVSVSQVPYFTANVLAGWFLALSQKASREKYCVHALLTVPYVKRASRALFAYDCHQQAYE